MLSFLNRFPRCNRTSRWLTILAIIVMPGSALAQKSLSSKDVEQAIEKSVHYLWQGQGPDGGWPEGMAEYPRGVSCLTTLALLNSGEDPDSPQMRRALNYVTEAQLKKTYTVSLQTMTMCAANPEKYAAAITSNIKWLVKEQLRDGGWGYGSPMDSSDQSNSQFALLALHEAQRVGVQIPDDIRRKSFEGARAYWHRLQNKDGSFGYREEGASGSMTCAGISSMIIIGSQPDQLDASARDEVQCCGQENDNQRRIESALAWLGNNFEVNQNPGGAGQWFMYYMYGMERAGRLAGRRYFLDSRRNQARDWYREGADVLIKMQSRNGSFQSSSLGGPYVEAAMGLLFLAKGKRQVVVNRLQYGTGDEWNIHPMSVQHLTAHTEQAWKRDLTWQTVRIKQALVEDLMEAPVLFISGSAAPNFSREDKILLKRYVEQGGFIFAEACHGNGCNGKAFEDYFKTLVVELFEQPLEKLPPDHPIWSAEALVEPKDLPDGAWLYGVQSCCRLGLVYSPYSLSCRWELNLPYGNRPDYSAAVQGDLNTATKIGINVLSYVTGKELKEKLDSVSVLDEVVQQTSTDRGLFVLPKIVHNAGADDAPKSVKTLIEWLNQENPFQMSSEKRMIPLTKEELEDYAVVYMHGRGKLVFDDAQREALREHFRNGGTLICDAICSDEQFTNSFRTEMELVLGKSLERLDPAKHSLFSSKNYRGFDIAQLSIIDPQRGGGQLSNSIEKEPPIIEAGYHDNRIAVLFSPLDISCALESKHSMQCKGYVREDAARLGINLILFALQQGVR